MNENIFRKILNEEFYKNDDFDKHDFKYLNKVLNDFKTKNTIFLKNGNNKKGIKTNIENLKSKEFKNNITRFQNWLNNEEDITDDDRLFNKIKFSKDEYSSDKRDVLLDAFNKFFGDENSPLKQWMDIEKTDYSIIRTPEQEGIQAIFLAAKLKGKKYFDNISKLYTPNTNIDNEECEKLISLFYKNDLGIALTNDIIDFSNENNKKVLKKLANILNINEFPQEFENLKKTEFTIIHPDGLKNINNKVNNEDVVELTKVLFGGSVKWEVKNQDYSLSLQKDNFIPADLYIIPFGDNNKNINNIKTMINAAGKLDPYSMVGLSNNLMGTGDEKVGEPLIYPISLKMLSNNPHIIKIINSEKKNPIQIGMSNIKFIHFNQTGNSTMGIEYEGKRLVLEFRSKGEKNGKHQLWQCNALNKDNRNAIEGGSAKNYMKFVFKNNMNGSIEEKDVKEIARVFGGKIGKPSFTEALAESFKRFFEDDVEEKNKLTQDDTENEHTWNDIEEKVLLAVPSNPKVRGESSAKEGCIGLGLFCKKLIENDIEKNLDYNEALSKIVQMSFKMNEIVQDTWKIM